MRCVKKIIDAIMDDLQIRVFAPESASTDILAYPSPRNLKTNSSSSSSSAAEALVEEIFSWR